MNKFIGMSFKAIAAVILFLRCTAMLASMINPNVIATAKSDIAFCAIKLNY